MRGREGEAAVDVLALLVRVRLAVVEVDRASRALAREVDRDDERDRVAPGQYCGPADEVTAGEDRATALENRERVEGSRDLDVSAAGSCAKVDLVRRVVVVRLRLENVKLDLNMMGFGTCLVVGDIDRGLSRTLSNDGLDEEAGAAEVELVVDGETLRVVREENVLRSARESCQSRAGADQDVSNGPKDGNAGQARLVKRGVHSREDRVAEANCVADVALDGLLEEVRLAALRVDVAVRAEERREGADLVPIPTTTS